MLVKFAPTVPGPATGTLSATSAEGAEATVALSGTGGSDVLLYGQLHDWDTMPSFFASRNATYTSTPEFDAELADDFVVEDPDGWTISRVGLEISTFIALDPRPPFDVHFMLDDGGLPGEVAVCSAPDSQVVFWEDPFYEKRVEVMLSSPCRLLPGHYWLRVRPTLDSFEGGLLFVGWGLQFLQGTEEEPPGEPPIHLNPTVWRNPGGDTGLCPDWTPIYPPACGFEDWFPFLLAYDAVFSLIGQVGETPWLVFEPASIDFGDVVGGGTNEAQTVTLSNLGGADATGLSFNGLPDSGFDADTSVCGGALPVGGSCEISVTFAPSEPGPAGATLRASSAEGASADLPLAGNAIGGFTPMALEVDPDAFLSNGNGIFEPGELVYVAPAWRNDGLVEDLLIGSASSFNGSSGGVYLLALDDADYGNVGSTEIASCRDTGICYFLGVNDPAVRPATHWEATFDETLSDGTTHTWGLHIGDSFLDVPRTSPFYIAVETLLHHGVTGGCGEAQYCPAGTNTRGQMAVFLLKAAEDEGYVPPACVENDERFADVPFDHPLCPWIEELAERGVTSGCGSGNYCPGDPVSRAQMAVFLLKAFEGDGYTPQECSGMFSDVDCSSTFAAWVEELAARGVTGGCAADPPAYCPKAPVTRAQMAVFLTKILDFALYGP